jgi:hypothetical protein
MPPTHPAEKRVSYTFDALGMTINRTAFNLQKAFARFRYSSIMVIPLEMATFLIEFRTWKWKGKMEGIRAKLKVSNYTNTGRFYS